MRISTKIDGEICTYWECDDCGYDLWPECNEIYEVDGEHFCARCLLKKFRKDMAYASVED